MGYNVIVSYLDKRSNKRSTYSTTTTSTTTTTTTSGSESDGTFRTSKKVVHNNDQSMKGGHMFDIDDLKNADDDVAWGREGGEVR